MKPRRLMRGSSKDGTRAASGNGETRPDGRSVSPVVTSLDLIEDNGFSLAKHKVLGVESIPRLIKEPT
jgi:hypothetical protein